MTTPALVDHFFRQEYGKLVAVLCSRVGAHHIEAIEDAVQSALWAALETWKVAGLPDDPSAWVFRVAHNELMGGLRQGAGRRRILEQNEAADPETAPAEEPAVFLAGELQDDLLRLLFVCCDPAIPEESRLVLALKTLCGFSTREIAQRLFASEANVHKRLARARDRLRNDRLRIDDLSSDQTASRLPSVHKVLYTLFTEGHLASHPELAIRRELCGESLRLAGLLAAHPVGGGPETAALLALMHLHTARIDARQDADGALLLLEEQDRSLFDVEQIEVGLQWLARSAQGDVFSRYHAEAAIAAEHCLAPSFSETRWEKVVASYALLESIEPSPLHRLNRAVAMAEWQGPSAGLAVLEGFEPPTWLADSYHWPAVLSDLHRRCGNAEDSRRYFELAQKLAPTPAVREVLGRRLGVAR